MQHKLLKAGLVNQKLGDIENSVEALRVEQELQKRKRIAKTASVVETLVKKTF